MEKTQHIWQFSRIGGINRVILEKASDLIHLDSLDQKLWTALSCPVNGLEIDAKTLQMIDKDNDGKIRVPEVIAAVKWILPLLNEPEELIERRNFMPLSAINTKNPEGLTLFAAAKQILLNLGKSDTNELTVSQTADTSAIFANTKYNGDGIITDISTEDNELKSFIQTVMARVGSVQDRSGKEGISATQLQSFFSLCEAYSDWQKKAEKNQKTILPYADKTEFAYEVLTSLQSKMDDYFLRCRLAEFDPQSAEKLNTLAARIDAISDKYLTTCLQEIESYPIAKIEVNKPFSFQAPMNPVWKNKLMILKNLLNSTSVLPVESISGEEWKAFKGKFDAYSNWKSEQAGSAVEPLGLDAVRAILASDKKEQIMALIEQDKALETEANNVIKVDKLVRFYCHLFTFLNNFVTFSDFYTPCKKAVFQAGTLYFDQRCCDLCIKVADLPKHAAMDAISGICLVFLDCVSRVKNEKMTIVAAFTDGDVDNLNVGRNGVFYDTANCDWDATIVKVIDNPISIRQAFWAPYRKMSKMISKQMEKMAAAQDDKVNSAASSGIEKAGDKPTAVKPPFDIAKFAGIFAAIGLALGAIASVFVAIIGGLLALSWWKIPLVFLAIMLIISCPSMFLAWLKLRKRNLAPLLDANGWAVNARATINIAFGATLTHLAKLPKNAKLNLKDPFAPKKNPLIPIVFIIIVIAIALLLRQLGILAKGGIL